MTIARNRKSLPRYLLVHEKPRNTGSCPRDKIVVEMIAVVSNEEEKEEEEELEGELEEEGENEEGEEDEQWRSRRRRWRGDGEE